MRTGNADHHVIELQRRDLGHAETAATSKSDNNQIALRVC
jgi:hypothetical protein